MADVKLFLSCVSDEFGAYRESLRHALTRPNVEIKIQEDFQALGGDTLAMLEAYVETCNVVVHFIGEMAGAAPKPTSVDDLLKRRADLATRLADKGMGREALGELTYTQWEAWLAIGFNQNGAKKNLVIVAPAAGLKRRGRTFKPTDASRAAQAEHLRRLRAINLYPGPPFTSADNLAVQVLASPILEALIAAPPKTKPRNLPLLSLGSLFAGREQALEDLRAALLAAKGGAVALFGLGGVGKTRLAIEYGWAREADHSALLFVSASDAASLNAGLAALAGPEMLDLPEKEARDDETKIAAALRWLATNPTWLMILDNVDDGAAVAAVSQLLPRLKGGHVDRHRAGGEFPSRHWQARTRRARARTTRHNSCSTGRRAIAARLPTTRRWRGQLPPSLAASRSGWSRRARISPPNASASPTIWRCGPRRATGRSHGPIRS